MKVVSKSHIVEAFQFSIRNPHAIPGVLDPLAYSALYEVQLIGGDYLIINDGDFIIRDHVGIIGVCKKDRFYSLYKKAGDNIDPNWNLKVEPKPELQTRFEILKKQPISGGL